MERLKSIKDCLIAQVSSQMGKLDQVDAKELGEVVDMIKDMEEACYYAKITEAMEKGEEEKKYYTEYYRPYSRDYLRDMDKNYGRMYYGGDWSDAHETSKTNGATYYTERPYSIELRDRREGRSPMSRKMYMESKELHKDKTTQLKDLENYMQELSIDIAEMIDDASPEEKQMLQSKIAALANKIK